MEFQELKRKSHAKVLLRGKSSRGKTYNACLIVIKLLEKGADILYIDTESEGSTTIVHFIEDGEYPKDIVENLDYIQVDDYGSFMDALESQSDYDLVVVDTLDTKHSYVLKHVTDAKTKAGADWNEYPKIYSEEKELMDKIGKPTTNILATLDPDSGKMDKPKGAQTNVHGFFNTVIDLKKTGDDWTNKVINFVGRSDLIGVKLGEKTSLADNLANHITDRIEDLDAN